jgi:hypothetical protein
MIPRYHEPTGNKKPQKNRKQREYTSGDKGTHCLLVRAHGGIVSEDNETQLMHVRTSCEHKRAETSSARPMRPS